ncbi:MAG: lytic murein transglycosylase [Patescibacteria group bacterium]
MKRVIIFLIFLMFLGFFQPFFNAKASLQDEINARNQQIEQLQRQIDDYQRQIEQNGQKAKTLSGEIGSLNAQISKVQLEIKSLNISIDQTGLEIDNTQGQIKTAQEKLEIHKDALSSYIRILDRADHENLTLVLFKHATISDFFDNLKNLQDTQDNLRTTIISIKDLKIDLEQKEDALLDKKNDLEKLKGIEQAEKYTLDQTKSQKNKLLKDTKGEETKFQQLLKQSKQDIARIKEQVTYLQQNGVSVEDAIKFGQLAAIATGIRPAYLIAVLEVESGLGRNVGRCNRAGDPPSKGWQMIMHSRDHAPFAEITSQLGLDTNTTAVSCPQFINGKQFGWGGAMGPAQFIPSTWVGYKDQVTRITGHDPANPWNIEDAFMASALKLAKGGATSKTRTGEIAAAKAYYSGNSQCSKSSCNSYASAVLNKAAIIEQNL